MNTRELIEQARQLRDIDGASIYGCSVAAILALADLAEYCLAAGVVNEHAQPVVPHGWRTVPPDGYVLCSDGVARKVLGTLPVTADGFLAGSAAELWWRDSEEERTRHIMVLPCNVSDCYSTPEACEAAEAAREASK